MSKMISVAAGFQYSVNIEYDLGNVDKLKNFIPTAAALDLLEEILLSTHPNSTERARILIGAYGRGKSHVVLTILSLLMKTDLALFEKLLPKLNERPRLQRLIENFYATSEKILPVIINGTATNLNQSFLLALQRTLEKFDLQDILPETNFAAAVKVLHRWEKSFPSTFAAFKRRLNEPVKNFVERLENFDVTAYEKFERLYPELTAGSAFNPFVGFDVVELFESVAESLRAKGYSGLFVVYDEFSKFLESNIARTSVSDTKMLQDFAEKVNRSGKLQLHLMLISHKEIANYIDALSKEKVDGWRGVSNRFRHVRLSDDFSESYEIISAVIRHEPALWKKFCARYADDFRRLRDRYTTQKIFVATPSAIEACFPLHPVSTFILPRLSERVAQNERTLFTFLSAEGVATLPAFLEKFCDDFTLLTPDKIYDYFEPLFRYEFYEGTIHKIFSLATRILSGLESPLAAKIVKTIALIYMLEQFELLAPKKEQIMEIFPDNAAEFNRAFDELTEKKFVVYLRQSNNFLKLKQSSGVDIKQKIHDTAETLDQKISVATELNALNFDDTIYPSHYNAEHEMTRWFDCRFVNVDDWASQKFSGDGTVLAILPSDEENFHELTEKFLMESRGRTREVFILPKDFVDVSDAVKTFAAVERLRTLAEDDSVLCDEYDVVLEDLQMVLKNFIDGYTRPELGRAIYIHAGKILPIYRRAALSRLLSEICGEVYALTPVINNEVINRNELTNIATNSRGKILDALLRRKLEPGLGLRGNGQEVSIMRSALIRTDVFVDDDRPRINLLPADSNMRHLLTTIENFLKRGGNFGELYDELILPRGRIGLRRGVIPIYLAAVLNVYQRQVTIRKGSGVVRLNAETLALINSMPEKFSLEFVGWSADKEIFVDSLGKIFADFVVNAEKSFGTCDYVANAMYRWFVALPTYAKEIPAPEKFSTFRNILRQNLNGTELLFQRLPKSFSEDFTATLSQVTAAKKFFDGAVDNLARNLLTETKKFFPPDWLATLSPQVHEHFFSDGTEKFLRLIKSAACDSILIERLAFLATGLRLEDWNARTSKNFFERLTAFKLTAEKFSPNESEQPQIVFETAELSPRAKLLRNQITAAIEAMGSAITVSEKRQVLLEILHML